jgi:hypothetical protein
MTILVLLTSLSAAPALQAGEGRRFFPETYHWVEGEFLDFYNNTPNPARLLGYPITDAFGPSESGTSVSALNSA